MSSRDGKNKLVFVKLTESNTFPRGEGGPRSGG